MPGSIPGGEQLSYSPSGLGEVAERSKAAVLKTVGPRGSGGSNPSLSAILFIELSRFLSSPRPAGSRFCDIFATLTASFWMARAPVATIVHRGSHQWQVRVRRKGYPPVMKTFETKAEAKR